MLTNLKTAIKTILPFFTKGGRIGSWRMYIITFGALVTTMQGQDMLMGMGLTPWAVMWLVERATKLTLAATFITMIKDHMKAAAATNGS